MQSNSEIIREFIEAWSRLDPKELAGYFTEDGVYYNIPAAPVEGRENVENMIRGFTAGWKQTQWDILNLVAEGDLVVAERLDRTQGAGKSVDLPCVGVFEMENGKIKVWRDYFDLGTYMRAMS